MPNSLLQLQCQPTSSHHHISRINQNRGNTIICFSTIPNLINYCAEYQEVSEGEPTPAGVWGVLFAAGRFNSGDDSSRNRNRDDTAEGVGCD